LFFGGADVTHKRIHHHAPRRRKTKKLTGEWAGTYKQANPTGFEPAVPIARIRFVERFVEKMWVMTSPKGDVMFLKVQFENGQYVNLAVDTGSSRTIFDKSLQPLLGHRLGTAILSGPAVTTNANVYWAPKMQLGNVNLVTGWWVVTMDLSKFGYPGPLQGILGMDCLRHYCIQLDFEASKWRFLDPANLDTRTLGQSFPLFRSGGCFVVPQNLVAAKGQGSLIDTGCNFDGMLAGVLFQQWTNHSDDKSGLLSCARSPDGTFGGETYTNLDLHPFTGNVLGLSFLSRHLVTLNFPKHTMYLKRVSGGPLPKEWPWNDWSSVLLQAVVPAVAVEAPGAGRATDE